MICIASEQVSTLSEAFELRSIGIIFGTLENAGPLIRDGMLLA